MNIDSQYAARRGLAAAAVFLAAMSAGCDTPSGPRGNEGEAPTLRALLLSPAEQTVQAGTTLQFHAEGVLSDGGTSAVAVSWSATGGTITSGGLYTAGQAAGAFRVIATASGGVADTASVIVTVPAQNPVLVAVVVTPASATVAPGGTVQLAAAGLLSSGAATPVAVGWTATGGTVSGTGLYTAGAATGSFRVIATGPGGLADTATVAVTATGGGASYSRVAGDDWTYTTKDQLRAADYFWWTESSDVYNYVDLVPDGVFGQVVRITQPVNCCVTAPTPRLLERLPAPLEKMWYRWRMRYSPGWTTVGPDPAGHNNSYKIAFWGWENHDSRGEVLFANTDDYHVGWSVKDRSTGAFLQYGERVLAGSAADFGEVGTEWSDQQWQEFVVYYERTGATSARQHWWRRRLTTNGAVAPGPWIYIGREFSGSTTPRVDRVELGINKNKSTPVQQYVYWGPWEVVDGSRHPNPWNMPNVSGGTPPPTLTRVNATPDTATLAPGAQRQFSATGTYSDGSSQPVAVVWSATGGTITSAGLYTAPSTTGAYRVIARESAGGLADTSTVTVAAGSTATLQRVILTPATASVQTGGTVQFTATGSYSDGTSKPVASTWSATGGTISTSGLYTAGATAGTFRVIAVAQGSTKADTSAVTVTAPPPGGGYTRLLGDDWRSYTSKTALSTYYTSADLANVELVSDPTFGQVVRLTHRAGSTASPRLTRSLPAPANRAWYRWRVRFSPGWTLGGGAWTMSQWTWSGYNGAASAGFTGTSHTLGFNVRDASWRYLSYGETVLPGSSTWGSVGTEFSDGQWYEYVMLWEKTGSTTGRHHWWVRRLTTGGTIVNNPWKYYGISLSGNATPQVGAIALGAGNLGRAPATTQYAFWGPWEVVDGTRYANPFGMPGF